MNRRDSLKSLVIGSLSAGLILEACNSNEGKNGEASNGKAGGKKFTSAPWAGQYEDWETHSGRQPFEIKRDKELMSKQFFTNHEMKTIGVLADIIIPKDDKSGSATDAGVPDFIEFIVKDMPYHQTPMRGGLRWMDMQTLNRHGKAFVDCDKKQQMALVDEIAWPGKAKPEVSQGVNFFSLMRNLTASGFYSSEIGIKDMGYAGNTPNVWDGVPGDVLKQYNVSYTQEELNKCVKKENHNKMFVFES